MVTVTYRPIVILLWVMDRVTICDVHASLLLTSPDSEAQATRGVHVPRFSTEHLYPGSSIERATLWWGVCQC